MKGWRQIGLQRWRKLFTNGSYGEVERVGGVFMASYGTRFLGDADGLDWAVDLVEAYHETVRR